MVGYTSEVFGPYTPINNGQMMAVLYDVTEVPTAPAGRKRNTRKVDVVAKLFDEYATRYAESNHNGGYTRIVKIGQRKGDAAMEVLLELV